MIAKAIARHVRVSPRKVRLVIDLIRGKSTTQAMDILFNVNKGSKQPVEKVLKSALSNAETKSPSTEIQSLYISKITADGGPMLKRYRAAAMGRATLIHKRTTHILIELDAKKITQKPATRGSAGSSKMRPTRGSAGSSKMRLTRESAESSKIRPPERNAKSARTKPTKQSAKKTREKTRKK